MPVTNTIFKILCFQYFNFPDFHLPGISECCYIYYSPPNLYFSISLLSNEKSLIECSNSMNRIQSTTYLFFISTIIFFT